MLFQFLEYLKFLWYSKNQYGVHSPFVYQFLIKGIYKSIDNHRFKKFKKLKKELLKNHLQFEISDFGAGSKIYKNNFRSVAQLTKTVSISNKKAKLLFKIINYFQPRTILELGTCIGLGTTSMALATKNSVIYTVEGCEKINQIAEENFKKLELKNIKTNISQFSSYLKNLPQDTQFDAIFIDGNHTYQATLAYFDCLLQNIHNNSFLIFDDIHWNKEMQKAWQEIIKNQKVIVSIDLFYFGLIFFRKEQEKEHFILRT